MVRREADQSIFRRYGPPKFPLPRKVIERGIHKEATLELRPPKFNVHVRINMLGRTGQKETEGKGRACETGCGRVGFHIQFFIFHILTSAHPHFQTFRMVISTRDFTHGACEVTDGRVEREQSDRRLIEEQITTPACSLDQLDRSSVI